MGHAPALGTAAAHPAASAPPHPAVSGCPCIRGQGVAVDDIARPSLILHREYVTADPRLGHRQRLISSHPTAARPRRSFSEADSTISGVGNGPGGHPHPHGCHNRHRQTPLRALSVNRRGTTARCKVDPARPWPRCSDADRGIGLQHPHQHPHNVLLQSQTPGVPGSGKRSAVSIPFSPGTARLPLWRRIGHVERFRQADPAAVQRCLPLASVPHVPTGALLRYREGLRCQELAPSHPLRPPGQTCRGVRTDEKCLCRSQVAAKSSRHEDSTGCCRPWQWLVEVSARRPHCCCPTSCNPPFASCAARPSLSMTTPRSRHFWDRHLCHPE